MRSGIIAGAVGGGCAGGGADVDASVAPRVETYVKPGVDADVDSGTDVDMDKGVDMDVDAGAGADVDAGTGLGTNVDGGGGTHEADEGVCVERADRRGEGEHAECKDRYSFLRVHRLCFMLRKQNGKIVNIVRHQGGGCGYIRRLARRKL